MCFDIENLRNLCILSKAVVFNLFHAATHFAN